MAIRPFIHVQRVSNLHQCYCVWSISIIGLPRLVVYQSMLEGFIFSFIIYILFILYLFECILIEKIITYFEEASRWRFIARKYLCYKKHHHFRASPILCMLFFNMSNWRGFYLKMKNFNQLNFLFQLSIRIFLSFNLTPLHEHL